MPAPPANPVTAAHADAFRLYVEHWRHTLGLEDWRIAVPLKRTRRRLVQAECSTLDLEQRLAVIQLGVHFWGTPVTEQSLYELAFHEVTHVWLHELTQVAKAGDADAIHSQQHRLINVLERLLAADVTHG